jgi:hypothetical protein
MRVSQYVSPRHQGRGWVEVQIAGFFAGGKPSKGTKKDKRLKRNKKKAS